MHRSDVFEPLHATATACRGCGSVFPISPEAVLGLISIDGSDVQALWNALLVFRLLPKGFSNAQLRIHLAELMGKTPTQITPGAMTYQLRRLRLHGLIQRIPSTHRYQVTDLGFRAGLFFSKVYSRILRPGIAFVLPAIVAVDSKLRRAFRNINLEVENWIQNAKLVAA